MAQSHRDSALPLWILTLYFGLAAPIQEEIIFRGLLQSFLEQRWVTPGRVLGVPTSPAVLVAATLFGLVHFDGGPAVAACALVLGLLAGELRRRSGSLVPAIIAHALFNLPGLMWP